MKTNLLTILILCFCLLGQKGISQIQPNKIRIGAYFGATFDAYKIKDTGGWLDDGALGYGSGGLEIDFEYADNYSIGGGLHLKSYVEGVYFKNILPNGFSPSMNTFQFPAYFRTRTYFQKRDAIAFISGGAALVVNRSYDSKSFEEGTYSGSDGMSFNYSSETDVHLKRIFPLVFIETGVDTRIFNKNRHPESKDLRTAFSVRRYFGFTEIMKLNVDYSVNNGGMISAEEIYKGGYWMFSIFLLMGFER